MKTQIAKTDFRKKGWLLLPLTLLLAGCGGSTNSTNSATFQPKVGTYGSSTDHASLVIATSGGKAVFVCTTFILTEPLVADSSGHFDVTAYNQFQSPPSTLQAAAPHIVPPPPPVEPFHLVGTISGNTITISQKPFTGTTATVYKLVFAQQPVPLVGACGN